jgi:hypothetical protein
MSNTPPRRRSLPLIALMVGLVVVVLGGAVLWWQRQPPPLQVAEDTTVVLTPLDARGRVDYETPLNELFRQGITPQNNAMVLMSQAIGPKPENSRMHADWWAALGVPEPPDDGPYLKHNTFRYFEEETSSDDQTLIGERREALLKEENHLREQPWTTADSPHFAKWLRINAAPLKIIEEASRRPQYYHPLISGTGSGEKGDMIGALIPFVQLHRAAAGMLTIRAMWHLGEGRVEEAFADALTVLRLGRLILDNPSTFVEFLAGTALQTNAMNISTTILQHAQPTPEMLKRWKVELSGRNARVPWLLLVNNTERFSCLDSSLMLREVIRTGNESSENFFRKMMGEREYASFRADVRRADWNQVLQHVNRTYDILASLTQAATSPEIPLPQRREGRHNLTAELNGLRHAPSSSATEHVARKLTEMFAPPIDKMMNVAVRLEQSMAYTDLAFDLEAYHRTHQRYPDTLAELKRPTQPLDLFSLKPLKYTRTDSGYILHCFGPDETENWYPDPTQEKLRGDDTFLHFHRGGPPKE